MKRVNYLQIPFDEGKAVETRVSRCICSPATRIRAKRSCCQGNCQSFRGQGSAHYDEDFLQSVRQSVPVSEHVWQSLRHRYPTFWMVYSRPQSWLPGPAVAIQEWAKHPNRRFCECLRDFWSQDRWYVPNDPHSSDCRITWQELLVDFIAEFGFIKGFLEPHVRLSLLTRRFRDQSVKLLSVAHLSLVGLSNISHLRCFTGGNAAGICARRQFKFPHVVWAFFISQSLTVSRRQAQSERRPNAHYTPLWDFLPP